MSRELTPITEFPVANALPEYLDADRIGVDVSLLGTTAAMACFRSNVQIDAYHGPTSSYNVAFGGMSGEAATATATSTASIEKRGDALQSDIMPDYGGFLNAVSCHSVPTLTAKLNVSEIQQRLQHQNAVLRDPKVWSRQLNAGLGEALRGAARKHILAGSVSCSEAIGAANSLLVMDLGGEAWRWAAHSDVSHIYNFGIAVAGMVFFNNRDKANRRSFVQTPHAERCYSLVPGFHLDRYLAVVGLTKLGRLIRPISTTAS